MFFDKNIRIYLLKFIISYSLLYFGSIAVIGFTAPGGYYSSFIHDYLNYIAWIRTGLLYSSKYLLTGLGYNVFVDGLYIVRMHNGLGVHLVYSCIGLGVMSFWVAFVYANAVRWQKKAKWIIIGLVLIFFINVLRISILLIAVNKKWHNIFNLDNHTLFNIAAYTLIFTMIYSFDRSERVNMKKVGKDNFGK